MVTRKLQPYRTPTITELTCAETCDHCNQVTPASEVQEPDTDSLCDLARSSFIFLLFFSLKTEDIIIRGHIPRHALVLAGVVLTVPLLCHYLFFKWQKCSFILLSSLRFTFPVFFTRKGRSRHSTSVTVELCRLPRLFFMVSVYKKTLFCFIHNAK